jgi:hypothetical protein
VCAAGARSADLERRAPPVARRRDAQERPDRLGDTPLLADHLPHIALGDVQLDRDEVLARVLANPDLLRIIGELAGDEFD